MSQLWIVDRSPRRRASLARLAQAPESAISGAPGDPRFETAPAPDVVLLSVDEDWEQELQFAFTTRRRTRQARFLLVGPRGLDAQALAAFDAREVEYLTFPPPADRLRARLRRPLATERRPSLSERQRRAEIAERFALWFEDAELPDVLAALDPKLADVPVLIRGEDGTGRALVARYLHLFVGTAPGAIARIACRPELTPALLIEELAAVVDGPAAGGPLTVWLENPDRLGPGTQRAVLDWVELGLPTGVRASRVRFIATVDETGFEALDAALRWALCGLSAQLPPLRERSLAIGRIAQETLRQWAAARQERPRRLGEDALTVLEEYPWPGNLRELDAVLAQSLASSSSDPLRADDLQLEGMAFSPLEAGEIGELLEDGATAEAELTSPGFDPAPPHEMAPVVELVEEPLDAALTHETFGSTATGPTEQEIDDLLGATSPPEEAEPPAPPSAEKNASAGEDESTLAALARALASDGRSPLETIRALALLLPERFEDAGFRERFAEALRRDAGQMAAMVERLEELAELETPSQEKVNVTALLEGLLEARRQQIRAQRLLVLKELDTHEPDALCDPGHLHFALETLIGKALDWVPPQGDVYLASRHHAATTGREASVRVLIRFHDPGAGNQPAREPGAVEDSFELMVCEIVIRAQGGTLSVTSTEGEETVIVIDLPA